MVLLSDLYTQAMNRVDMAGSNHVSSTEALPYINAAAAELHEFLITQYGSDYAYSESYYNQPSGNDSLALPSDFFKLLGLDVKAGDGYAQCERFTFSERDRYASPAQLSGNIYRLTYVPRYVNATSMSDALPDNLILQNWSEYIVTDLCARSLIKQQDQDAIIFLNQKIELKSRISAAASQRDASQPYELALHQDPWVSDRDQYAIDSRTADQAIRYRLAGNAIKLVPLFRGVL